MEKYLIIFDMSDVCFSCEEPSFITDFCKRHNIDKKTFDREYQELIKRAEVSEMEGVDVWKSMLRKYGIDEDPREIIKNMMSGKVPYKDTLKIVKELKDQGHITVFLTNYNRDYWQEIVSRFDMSEYFSSGLVSYEINKRKPSSKGFLTIMENNVINQDKTIFIDDKEDNLEPAKELGIATHQFTSSIELREFFVEKGLLE